MRDYKNIYEEWLQASYIDDDTKTELRNLTEEEIQDRFYKDLAFGTGGLRGKMGAGTNRMNRYTVRKATYGAANALKARYAGAQTPLRAVIAYDSRNHSEEFATEAAGVLAACKIHVTLFSTLMPTPVLSFAVPYLNSQMGIVITASHNPKEYNGYKIYDEKGCQLIPEKAEYVIRYVEEVRDQQKIPYADYRTALQEGRIERLGEEVLEAFLEAVLTQSILQDKEAKAALRIVYTPLHGTGNQPVRRALKKAGFTQVFVVAAQEEPDGDFSTVRSPNPEERDALNLALAQAKHEEADLVLGTDPDCDRVGVGVLHQGEYRLLTGNQIGALLVANVCEKNASALSERSTLIKTIVTNDLGARIAADYGLQVVNTLTGFKFIGDKITEFERTGEKNFVIGYEESYGYLVGTHARDKDAVVASLLISEMAAACKAKGRTLVDELELLYKKYGYYLDALSSYTLEGAKGVEQIRNSMAKLRKEGIRAIPGTIKMTDYLQETEELPRSDVLKFFWADGSWMAARPSGTEPKIKFYYSICGSSQDQAEKRLRTIQQQVRELLEL
ncbi:phospho-sugar mutase [Diplocloster modestus]|uniref:phosphoglucomutase (alpha-D-glucose-1,6-bisphosphate-dependent) n=1 Tax=Diplocloster modestus TaxID=2850322 RepID=A0ABS6K3T0_9FIRM|nr:phospho-sugar mutase [Diplocloster modestus]MBU9725155.1 phospho-sugar mutase [Diplocloster modestus]